MIDWWKLSEIIGFILGLMACASIGVFIGIVAITRSIIYLIYYGIVFLIFLGLYMLCYIMQGRGDLDEDRLVKC